MDDIEVIDPMNPDFLRNLNRHIDISCVHSTHTLSDINDMISISKKYQFISVFAMPCYTPYLISQLKEEPLINVGGVVGFPTGCDTIASKAAQAKELVNMGCKELDMVMAYGLLKSKDYNYVSEDIKAVVSACNGHPVKVIIETSYLNDYEISKACELAIQGGASFVKSGTGWSPNPTTVHAIKIMKEAVGERALIKAAGGIRTLSAVKELAELGCERFGIGVASAVLIMNEAKGLNTFS